MMWNCTSGVINDVHLQIFCLNDSETMAVETKNMLIYGWIVWNETKTLHAIAQLDTRLRCAIGDDAKVLHFKSKTKPKQCNVVPKAIKHKRGSVATMNEP